jgi:hypothetical protein
MPECFRPPPEVSFNCLELNQGIHRPWLTLGPAGETGSGGDYTTFGRNHLFWQTAQTLHMTEVVFGFDLTGLCTFEEHKALACYV